MEIQHRQHRGLAIATLCFLLVAFQDSYTSAQFSPTPPDQPSLTRIFFECKDRIYHNQSMDMLFPPSAVSRRLIDDIAAAKENQKSTMEAFCGSASDFFGCVHQGLRQSTDMATNKLKSLLNPNLGEAFSIFCNNKELINSQFECTLRSLNIHACNGGVHDVMEISYAIGLEVDTLCREVVSRMTCRVMTQLSSCGMAYSNIMSEFYQALFSDSCRNNFFPERKITALYPCVEDYSRSITERLSGSNMVDKNVNSIDELIIHEMEIFCSTYLQPMLNCVDENLKSSQKPVDVMIKKFVNMKNYRNMANYVCSKVPDVKPHMKCLIKAMTDAFRSSKCLEKYTGLFNDTITDVTQLNTEKYIDAGIQMGYCFEPLFRDCDSGIGDIYHYLIDKSAEMMRDPQKAQVFSEEDRNSTNRHQYPTLLTLLCLALIVKELVSIWV